MRVYHSLWLLLGCTLLWGFWWLVSVGRRSELAMATQTVALPAMPR